MTFFSQAHRTCGTTHFIRLCTILHATGFELPPNFEDWFCQKYLLSYYVITYIVLSIMFVLATFCSGRIHLKF